MKSKIITIFVQLRDLWLYIFRNAIILNGYVDDHTMKGINHRNWGDDLNFYFISKITKRPVIFYHNFRIAKWLHLKNYLCIGTLLDAVDYSNRQTTVWGSGVSGQDRDFVIPERILSVRGRLTREFLLKRNIECPEFFGDPALALPLFYKPKNITKKYKLGIIPHVIDLNHNAIEAIRKHHDDILIIDLANYSKWTDIIDKINSCECIASSSLHGLIVSDAYGVPNCWIELSGKISGGYFKFYDYASSVDRTFTEPYTVKSEKDITILKEMCKDWIKPNIDMQTIVSVCPFKIKRNDIGEN